MDNNLSTLLEIMDNKGTWCATGHGIAKRYDLETITIALGLHLVWRTNQPGI